jgi:hypothetical protein
MFKFYLHNPFGHFTIQGIPLGGLTKMALSEIARMKGIIKYGFVVVAKEPFHGQTGKLVYEGTINSSRMYRIEMPNTPIDGNKVFLCVGGCKVYLKSRRPDKTLYFSVSKY